jgi:hypothetical protein
MKSPILISLLILAGAPAGADVVYQQPPASTGALHHSSWWDPDGSDWDQYVWDAFTLAQDQSIAAIRWRGGYDPAYFGSGGPVLDFTLSICASIPAGTEPDIVKPPLARYSVGSNAGEQPAGTFGGTAMYDYAFTLPAPFAAAAGNRYWVQIEAWQHGIPDWGITAATSGDAAHFRRITYGGDAFYQMVPGDAAFALETRTVGVGDGSGARLALEGVRPNPARAGRLEVWFALASDAPARLELVDVSGRRIESREVGALGAGRHALSLAPGRVAAGLHFVRLTQGGVSRVIRVSVLE